MPPKPRTKSTTKPTKLKPLAPGLGELIVKATKIHHQAEKLRNKLAEEFVELNARYGKLAKEFTERNKVNDSFVYELGGVIDDIISMRSALAEIHDVIIAPPRGFDRVAEVLRNLVAILKGITRGMGGLRPILYLDDESSVDGSSKQFVHFSKLERNLEWLYNVICAARNVLFDAIEPEYPAICDVTLDFLEDAHRKVLRWTDNKPRTKEKMNTLLAKLELESPKVYSEYIALYKSLGGATNPTRKYPSVHDEDLIPLLEAELREREAARLEQLAENAAGSAIKIATESKEVREKIAAKNALLSTSQAAIELNTTARNVRNLIDAGKLKASLCGGHFKIERAEIDRFLRDNQAKPRKKKRATAKTV